MRPRPRLSALSAAFALVVVAVVVAVPGRSVATSAVQFVLSPPNVLVSQLDGQAGVLKETFDAFATGQLASSGTFAVGDFTATGSVEVKGDDVWGGSGSRYLVVNVGTGGGPNGSLVVVLAEPARYLGFWWAAGNEGDLVTLFGSVGGTGTETQLGQFDSTTIMQLLAGPTVTAVDGEDYASSLYRRTNAANQPFAFVNLQIDDPDLYMTRVVFSKTGTGGLELDNLTTSAAWGQAVAGATGSVEPTPLEPNPPQQPVVADQVPPRIVCEESELRGGDTVTCTVSGGPANAEVLWSVRAGAEQLMTGVVTPGTDGRGAFSFVIPPSAAGLVLAVELVDWTAPLDLGTVVGVVPVSVPAGEGRADDRLRSIVVAGLLLLLVVGRRGRRTVAVS